ncbi:hypothetical protein M0802_000412 [Mischocyttarus mexicanus]|nr:hypothetical protein M0802_000412 [Mischocyttarus mexicanus]
MTGLSVGKLPLENMIVRSWFSDRREKTHGSQGFVRETLEEERSTKLKCYIREHGLMLRRRKIKEEKKEEEEEEEEEEEWGRDGRVKWKERKQVYGRFMGAELVSA